MKTRELGRTGLNVSVVGLGGGQFAGSQHSIDEIKSIVQTALRNGVNLIDTARDYGEERLGGALKDIREEYYICSKTLAKDRRNTLEDIRKSLEKLNQDKIDIYLMHNPMDVQDYEHRKNQGVLEALKEAKDEGLVGNIGVSSDYVEPLKAAVQDDVDVIMTQYNVGNTLSKDLMQEASGKDIGVIASKPFAGGILVDPKADVEEGRDNRMAPEKALNFTLSNENVSSALVGARYPWQIEECAGVGENFHSNEIKGKDIRDYVFDFLGENFCRDCRYCWPCEELGYEFDIPEILRFMDRYEKYGFKRFPRIEFSNLDYRNKIKDFDECDSNCPFGIDIQQRLELAEEKLSLDIDEKEWIKRIKNMDREYLKDVLSSLEVAEDRNDIIQKIHTELVPSGKIDEDLGILLIRGIFSFGIEETIEKLEVVR